MNQITPTARLRLENQVAVVTGGTRGIGEGIVRRFIEEGAKVVFSSRSQEKGKALEKELSPNVAFYQADAASASDTEALMKLTAERFGKLDCVVNNARVGGEGGPIAGISLEGFNKSIALLLGGTFLGIKYAVPFMQAGGTIINIASVASLVGGYGSHAYTAAKFGVVGLTKSVALDAERRSVASNRSGAKPAKTRIPGSVTAICPVRPSTRTSPFTPLKSCVSGSYSNLKTLEVPVFIVYAVCHLTETNSIAFNLSLPRTRNPFGIFPAIPLFVPRTCPGSNRISCAGLKTLILGTRPIVD
jgi:NAD(P)-dependent dehydrogenase (short-subunit alcohol dehydrogenase family)